MPIRGHLRASPALGSPSGELREEEPPGCPGLRSPTRSLHDAGGALSPTRLGCRADGDELPHRQARPAGGLCPSAPHRGGDLRRARRAPAGSSSTTSSSTWLRSMRCASAQASHGPSKPDRKGYTCLSSDRTSNRTARWSKTSGASRQSLPCTPWHGLAPVVNATCWPSYGCSPTSDRRRTGGQPDLQTGARHHRRFRRRSRQGLLRRPGRLHDRTGRAGR
jgi:hypothetical protein